MTTLWDKIRKSVTDGMTVAAEKTEELSRLGKAKLDILTVKRQITKQLTELGGLVYEATKEGKQGEFFNMPEVQVLINSLKQNEVDLSAKETVYETLKQEK